MSVPIGQLRDLSTLFLRNEVQRFQNSNFESIDFKIRRYGLYDRNRGKSYLQFLRYTYKLLQKQYQNEYVLKNEILNKWVKEELVQENSIIFNEFNIGRARADLVMFNGASRVFEIKTKFDDTSRLKHQLENYNKIFNEVYLVVSTEESNLYLDFDSSVGIIIYDSMSHKLHKIREARYSVDIHTDVLMEVLHTKEYLQICENYYGGLPENLNAFNQFDICKKIISEIPKKEINSVFVEKMKERSVYNEFFNIINSEFNQICLSLNLNRSERNGLIEKLRKTII